MNILITSAGQRVSLVRAFQTELKKCFPSAKVLTVDLNPQLSPACNISDAYFKVGRVTDIGYIPELLQLCLQQGVKMIVPTIDTELQTLADNKRLFTENGIEVVISSSNFVARCRDKRKINEFFQQHNIRIPASIDKFNPTFPLFIKPFDGSLSVDTYLIKTPTELTEYHLTNEKLLFMEYIDKQFYDEYTVDMYYGRDHQLKCLVPRRRIAIRAGEISKGVTVKNNIIPFLKERLSVIDGAVGCLTLQLFMQREGSDIAAIEINPRFGGGYPLSYLAGANYPGCLIREYLMNETINYYDSWEANLLMLRYDHEIMVHDYKS